MKLRFFYRRGGWPDVRVVGQEADFRNPHNNFIRGFLSSDYADVGSCGYLTKALDDIVNTPDKSAVQEMNRNAWILMIRKTDVHVEFSLDETQEHTFSTEEVRRAAAGWLALLHMPDAPESQVIVNL